MAKSGYVAEAGLRKQGMKQIGVFRLAQTACLAVASEVLYNLERTPRPCTDSIDRFVELLGLIR